MLPSIRNFPQDCYWLRRRYRSLPCIPLISGSYSWLLPSLTCNKRTWWLNKKPSPCVHSFYLTSWIRLCCIEMPFLVKARMVTGKSRTPSGYAMSPTGSLRTVVPFALIKRLPNLLCFVGLWPAWEVDHVAHRPSQDLEDLAHIVMRYAESSARSFASEAVHDHMLWVQSQSIPACANGARSRNIWKRYRHTPDL